MTKIDWQAAKEFTEQRLLLIRRLQVDFVTANPKFRITSNFEDYPPRITVLVELKPTGDQRLRELYGDGDCTPRLAVIPDDDKRTCAAFVAELAETLGLRPWLESDGDGQLRYTLKPDYKNFKGMDDDATG